MSMCYLEMKRGLSRQGGVRECVRTKKASFWRTGYREEKVGAWPARRQGRQEKALKACLRSLDSALQATESLSWGTGVHVTRPLWLLNTENELEEWRQEQ